MKPAAKQRPAQLVPRLISRAEQLAAKRAGDRVAAIARTIQARLIAARTRGAA